jgi:3-oxoacyl-[acyl-carrier protein] reductase
LVLAARGADALASVAGELKATHPKQEFIPAALDFSDLESTRNATEVLRAAGIALKGLVLMPPQIPPTDEPLPEPAVWEQIFRQSFIGPLELLKQSLPLFSRTGRGKIVLISGVSSAQVLGHYATSNVLRLSWLAEAKTLAFALGPKGIHVNTLSLGGVMTEKYRTRIEQKARVADVSFADQMQSEVGNVPLRKYAAPEEVAAAVEGLLSGFSDHLTGVNILCDGGFTRAY